MSFILPVTGAPRSSIAGINPGHFGARHLEFAYNGNASGRSPRGMSKSHTIPMTQVGTAGIALSRDGWGISCTAADTGFYAVARNPNAFAGDMTIMWRGVMLGAAAAGNYGCLAGVYVGDGTGSPPVVFSIERSSVSADTLSFIGASGGTYTLSDTNVGLSAFHNKKVTIVASNVVGTNGINVAISADDGPSFRAGLNTFSGATTNPRPVTALDRIVIGGQSGAGRYPNAVCTAVAMWSRAFPQDLLWSIATNHGDVFAPSYEAVLSSPTVTPSSGFWGGYYKQRGLPGLRLRG